MIVRLTTFSNGVPLYMEHGSSFIRAIDVGRMVGLAPRKVRKWAAQVAKQGHDVSKRKIPDSTGSRQLTVTLGYEAVLRINDYGAFSPDVNTIGIAMHMYDTGFAHGQATSNLIPVK